jgi:hypothetical protein
LDLNPLAVAIQRPGEFEEIVQVASAASRQLCDRKWGGCEWRSDGRDWLVCFWSTESVGILSCFTNVSVWRCCRLLDHFSDGHFCVGMRSDLEWRNWLEDRITATRRGSSRPSAR